MFQETTMVHNFEREKAENRYKSVLMGCLTHELRTPVNCVISGLDSLEYSRSSLTSINSDKLFKM